MTSKERMYAALGGKPVDRLAIAPCFWMAEYAWKLTGLPIWEILHGPDSRMKVVEALDERHGCDWVLPNHYSTRQLVGKTKTGEDSAQVYFADDKTGEEFVFHKEGHWVLPRSDIGTAQFCRAGEEIEPPRNKAEADAWMEKNFPRIFGDPASVTPDLAYPNRFPDRFLVDGVLCVFANLAYTMGFEPTLILLHDNPGVCAYMLEKSMTHFPRDCAKLVADGFDAGLMCDSFASADIMSPDTYRDYVAPFHKMASDECHKAGLKSIIYETGNILPFLDTISGLGYDAILPEERIKGVEIDIAEVRNGLGPDACIFGNFDSYLLLDGNRDRIRSEVRRQVSGAGPESFVMSSGSPICDATDPEVIDFWIEEAHSVRV